MGVQIKMQVIIIQVLIEMMEVVSIIHMDVQMKQQRTIIHQQIRMMEHVSIMY